MDSIYESFLVQVQSTLRHLQNGSTATIGIPQVLLGLFEPEELMRNVRASFPQGRLPAFSYMALRSDLDSADSTPYNFRIDLCRYDPDAVNWLVGDDNAASLEEGELHEHSAPVQNSILFSPNASYSDWGCQFTLEDDDADVQEYQTRLHEWHSAMDAFEGVFDTSPEPLDRDHDEYNTVDLTEGITDDIDWDAFLSDSPDRAADAAENTDVESDGTFDAELSETRALNFYHWKQAVPGKIYLLAGRRGCGKSTAITHLISTLPSAAKQHLLAIAPAAVGKTKQQDNGLRALRYTFDMKQALTYASKPDGTSVIVMDDIDATMSLEATLLPLLKIARDHGQTVFIGAQSTALITRLKDEVDCLCVHIGSILADASTHWAQCYHTHFQSVQQLKESIHTAAPFSSYSFLVRDDDRDLALYEPQLVKSKRD